MKNDYLRVGVITSPHGVHGELKVFPTTDDRERFEALDFVWIADKNGYRALTIEKVKYYKNLVIIKFKDISDRNLAESYRSKELYVDREHAIPLAENEYFLCDVIGAKVVTEHGELLGELTEVLQTGANDVYVVKKPDGKDILLPVIPDCVLQVDVSNALVTVHLLPGL